MSNLVKWDPFAELSALQKQFFGDDWMSPLKGVNIPTTDVYTKDNELVVEAHLPNFEQKDIDSRKTLKKLVDSALEDTNWRLMSDGISYRLGYLNGRVKAYESEDNLKKLAERNLLR